MNDPDSEFTPTKNREPWQEPLEVNDTDLPSPDRHLWRAFFSRIAIMLLPLVFLAGLGAGFLLWGRPAATPVAPADLSAETGRTDQAAAVPTDIPIPEEKPVALPVSYTLPITYADLGPQLLAAGAIDPERFLQVFEQAGHPLSEVQRQILTTGSDQPIVVDRTSAHFLLNLFWAMGVANRNPVLEQGPMVADGREQVGRFASTGGWTIGAKPATELYASTSIVTLTPEQQARLEEVAGAVYRPCCNNHTAFPDCNHGMAMLGLLELMAAQDASTDAMLIAAKYLNAFWFPQQTQEMALFFHSIQGQDFDQIPPGELVGPRIASGTGFQNIHRWLLANGKLEQAPKGGNSCGV